MTDENFCRASARDAALASQVGLTDFPVPLLLKPVTRPAACRAKHWLTACGPRRMACSSPRSRARRDNRLRRLLMRLMVLLGHARRCRAVDIGRLSRIGTGRLHGFPQHPPQVANIPRPKPAVQRSHRHAFPARPLCVDRFCSHVLRHLACLQATSSRRLSEWPGTAPPRHLVLW
jgi:hypothetical protein